MSGTWRQARSFSRPVQLLLINQLSINIGFYMLMPYLAGHLSSTLAMAAWAVGLILGVRNFSQQGMFLLGGSLADRLGYKPMILAGLALRVAGFSLLGFATSLPALIAASALTGLAGALFNPAVRAYLAAEAADRKTEAFALFNVFYQAGILAGPLIGLALLGAAFRWVCVTAALLFLVLLIAQAKALPTRRTTGTGASPGMLADWRRVATHRPFLLFALAMIGSYVLNFQVYLGLPIRAAQITGDQTGTAAIFVVSGLLTIAFQVRLTAWITRRWTSQTAIVRGLWLMAAAFIPLALTARAQPDTGNATSIALHMTPVLLSTALLTTATMIVYPFEMTTIVNLAADRLVGTYYGLYHTIAGVGIAAGNVLTGAALDNARQPALAWTTLTALGAACALAVSLLARGGHLTDPPHPPATATSPPSHTVAPAASR